MKSGHAGAEREEIDCDGRGWHKARDGHSRQSKGKGLDLEDLAGAESPRIAACISLAVIWILLRITVNGGMTENTWYLLAVGGWV